MAVRTFMGIMLALAIGASVAGAAGHRATGLVTAVADESLQITNSEQTTTISIDNKTGYMKWITHQPWQQDSRASSRSVAVGSCVDVELRAGDGQVAKLVRINTDGARTFYDPCKSIR
jgi:hypothetical protein